MTQQDPGLSPRAPRRAFVGMLSALALVVAGCAQQPPSTTEIGRGKDPRAIEPTTKKQKAKKSKKAAETTPAVRKPAKRQPPVRVSKPVTYAPNSISGAVRDTAGRALADVCVGLFKGTYLDEVADVIVRTTAAGTYEFTRLSAGRLRYRIMFGDCGRGRYADVWYDDIFPTAYEARGRKRATAITVTDGQAVTGIDGVIPRAGKISGRIRDRRGRALKGDRYEIQLFDAKRVLRFSLFTEGPGFEIGAIPPGRYKLLFGVIDGQAHRYAQEWYPNRLDFPSAGWVTVKPGVALRNLDAKLEAAGTISGSLTEGACAFAYTPSGDLAGRALSRPDGGYTLAALRATSYRVKFDDCGPDVDQFSTTWYNGERGFDSADPVSVRFGESTTGINGNPPRGGGGGGSV